MMNQNQNQQFKVRLYFIFTFIFANLLILFYFCFVCLSVIAVGGNGAGKSSIINGGNDGGLAVDLGDLNGGSIGLVLASGGLETADSGNNGLGSSIATIPSAANNFKGYEFLSSPRRKSIFQKLTKKDKEIFKQRFYDNIDKSFFEAATDELKVQVKKEYDICFDLSENILLNQRQLGQKISKLEITLQDVFCIDIELFCKKYLPWNKAEMKRIKQFASAKNAKDAELYVIYFHICCLYHYTCIITLVSLQFASAKNEKDSELNQYFYRFVPQQVFHQL